MGANLLRSTPLSIRRTSNSHLSPTFFFKPEHHRPTHDFKAEKSLISLIKSCTKKTQLLQIHAHLIRTSLLQNSNIFLAFLSRFCLYPFHDLPYSRRIFPLFSKPSICLYNTMIRAYSEGSSPEKGFEFYAEMLKSGISPNEFSASFAMKCCAKVRSLFGGMVIHSRILRDGYRSDGMLLTTLMELYSSSGKPDDACKVFDEMPRRDTVAWNVLISCYARTGRTRDVLGIFDMMLSITDCQPDDVTCLLVLQGCGNLNALEFGKKVHQYIQLCDYNHNRKVCNSLIAMYSRCGCVQMAYDVFKVMDNKDVVSWTSIISGLASNGYGRDAIQAFREMQRLHVAPDEQTFTGILSACSHSGLLEEGRMFFDCMTREFGIVPNVYHYSCLVDLLGRAGLLEEAYDVICSMRVIPDATIWRTLLGACRIHCHVALGERVIEHLIELKAQEAGDYVLLLNMYSSVGDWEKVRDTRKLMKDKGIQTTPSCSTIEITGRIHEFVADDISHPRKKEIYEMLDEINKQLKIAGYVAEITSEMHNTGAEEKQAMLSYHSEKLAIAFGVLVTPPGTKIRIAKDLQICDDCHNFAKTLSWVYNRQVIIRDRKRIHHFEEGRCSCGDYW